MLRNSFSKVVKRFMSVRARAIVYPKYGEPVDVIRTQAYDLPAGDSLKGDEVLLKTLAAPLNPSDINQVQGVYPSRPEISIDAVPGLQEPAAVAGNEGVFEVVGTGPAVSKLKPGDWCIPREVNYGTWRSHALSPEKDLTFIPNTIPLTQAATIAVNTSTAYLMLSHFADLQPGDWFIQNGGNSQVGRCAIQIAKSRGINSISVVRNRPHGQQELVDELTALGATHVITEEDNASRDFGKTIKGWTQGKPIKLGLNCVGGQNATGLSRKLGKGGYLVTYGGMSMKPVMIPTSTLIFKDLKVVGFWITEMTKQDPTLRERVIEEVLKLIQAGAFADIHCTLNKVGASVSDDEFAQLFKDGIANSKNGKQIMVFE